MANGESVVEHVAAANGEVNGKLPAGSILQDPAIQAQTQAGLMKDYCMIALLMMSLMLWEEQLMSFSCHIQYTAHE